MLAKLGSRLTAHRSGFGIVPRVLVLLVVHEVPEEEVQVFVEGACL